MRLFVVLALAIALLAVIFALQNTEMVAIDVLIWEVRSHLALVLLATLAIGVIIGLMVSVPAIIRGGWRLSRHQKQIEDMGWQFRQKDEEVSAQKRERDRLQRTHHDLLAALEVIHPRTETLLGKWLPQGIAYRIAQMRSHQEPPLESVTLFLLDYRVANGTEFALDPQRVQQLQQAIAHRIQAQLAPEIWLYGDEPGQLACLVPDLSVQSASEFGDSLRDRLLEQPISFADGAAVSIEVSVGGVIATEQDTPEPESLIKQAEETLANAKRRGRNRVRLVEANSG
jgi:GGDEF domain-containing protein/uncharacterized integral membrane protein